MNAKVVYFTKSGHTKTIAEAIASELSCECSEFCPIIEKIDVLFLGASIYKFGLDKSVIEYANSIDPAMVGKVVVFSTSSYSEDSFTKLSEIFTARGIEVDSDTLRIPGAFALMNRKRPNADDVVTAKQFARKVAAKNA